MKKQTKQDLDPQNPPASRTPFKGKQMERPADDALQTMIAFLSTRREKCDLCLSSEINDFLKDNLPNCFMHLDSEKRKKINHVMRDIISSSHIILSAEKGLKVFEWTVERAVAIASLEKAEASCSKMLALFNSSAKVLKLAEKEDKNRFFSAFDGLPEDKAAQMVQRISNAKTNMELKHAITMGYSQAQTKRVSPPPPPGLPTF